MRLNYRQSSRLFLSVSFKMFFTKMKYQTLIALLFLGTLLTFSQEKAADLEINMNSCNHFPLEKPVIVRHDLDKCETTDGADCLINGKRVVLVGLSPARFKSIHVRKPSDDVPNDKGAIEITVDKTVADSFNITVDEFLKKHIGIKDTMVLYLIDDKIAGVPGPNCYLNEKSVSSIEVYSSKNYFSLKGLNQEFKIVNILIHDKRNEGIKLKKPVVYVYSKEEKNITIQLEVKGKLTVSYPKYSPQGWSLRTKHNGVFTDITTGRTHEYLYWEANVENGDNHCNTGFVVPKDSTITFLERSLRTIGLNDKEANDFISYWLPSLNNNDCNFIHFLINQECDKFAKIKCIPSPESEIRVYMIYKPCSKTLTTAPQVLPYLARKDFTIVEWGGAEMNENLLK